MKIILDLAEYNRYHDALTESFGVKPDDFDVVDAICMHCQHRFHIQGLVTYTTPGGDTVYLCQDCMEDMTKAINTAINAFTKNNQTSVRITAPKHEIAQPKPVKRTYGETAGFLRKRDDLFESFDWDKRHLVEWREVGQINSPCTKSVLARMLNSLVRDGLIKQRQKPGEKPVKYQYLLPPRRAMIH